jgi:putative SOS response-associated peptidase YedK
MCARYEMNANAREVMARFGLNIPPPLPNRAEVRPTDTALVLAPDGPRIMRWGLDVTWSRQPLINARQDTLTSKPTFRRLLGNPVLIPATSWWEWLKDGKARLKHRLRPAGLELFAFAGLAEGERFTMVTTEACPTAAPVHDRMPLVLAAEAEAAWLAGALLSPFTGEVTVEREEGQKELF